MNATQKTRRLANPEGPTVVMSVSIPQALVDRLDALCEAVDKNRSGVLCEAVRRAYTERDTEGSTLKFHPRGG